MKTIAKKKGGRNWEYTFARLGSDTKHETILFGVVYIINPRVTSKNFHKRDF